MIRLQFLEKYKLWHTPPDAGLDRLTRIAAEHFQAPTALISLVGEDRQWFKSRVGLDVCDTSRDVSFCAHAILGSDVLVVPDALQDSRFKNNALVTGAPWIRFYAGAPLEVDTDIRLGSFCIIDYKPRPNGLSEPDRQFLKELAALAVGIFDQYLNRNLFEANPAPVYVVDAVTFSFLNCNMATVNLLGYKAAELEELRLSDIVNLNSSGVSSQGMNEKALRNGQSGPWKYIAKDDREVLALVTSRKISYLGRDAIMCILTDITTITDMQQRLHIALNLAETAVRAKTQFLATMSHELRTPLTHIIGMAELLLDTDVSDEQRGFAEVICDSGRELTSMVGEMLEYSRQDSGLLRNSAFSPETLVSAAVDKWSLACAEKSVKLESDVSPNVPARVVGDSSRIAEVLDRLLSNAVKFTPAGDIKIELSSNQEFDRGASLQFRVIDSGIGVSEELAGDLFKPFTQGDSSNTRQFGGTGLGLAICKKITDELNGCIGFSRSKEASSQFWFSVPVSSV